MAGEPLMFTCVAHRSFALRAGGRAETSACAPLYSDARSCSRMHVRVAPPIRRTEANNPDHSLTLRVFGKERMKPGFRIPPLPQPVLRHRAVHDPDPPRLSPPPPTLFITDGHWSDRRRRVLICGFGVRPSHPDVLETPTPTGLPAPGAPATLPGLPGCHGPRSLYSARDGEWLGFPSHALLHDPLPPSSFLPLAEPLAMQSGK